MNYSLLLLCIFNFICHFSFGQKVNANKTAVLIHSEALSPEVASLSDSLWEFSETALLEYKSAKLLSDKLENEGFTIEHKVAGMPTAFIASFGSGKPVIGIFAEYDALPGVGNEAVPEKTARKDKVSAGHGCGHNLFGAASVSAAIALKRTMEEKNINGTLRLYGCPAEETVIGKVYMAKAGLFDDLDAALHWHPGTTTEVWNTTGLALNNFSVEFFGKSAHGAFDPWNGRSALDGVEMMNYGVNLMREHVPPTARIHYVIPNGGEAPNVVPSYAKVWYFVRDIDRSRVESHYARILKIAEGAAMATETDFKVTLFTGVHELLANAPIYKEIQKNMEFLGQIDFSEKEQEWARKMQKNSGKPENGLDGKILPLSDQIPASTEGGSTDVAEVSYITPTGGFRVTTAPAEIPWHSWQASSSHGTTIGKKGAQFATKVLALTGIELFTNPLLLAEAKKDFKNRKGDGPYIFPIPQDQEPPLPESSGSNE